jgi:hypothetical protein
MSAGHCGTYSTRHYLYDDRLASDLEGLLNASLSILGRARS